MVREVFVKVCFVSIRSIDMINESMQCKFFVDLFWIDSSFVTSSSSSSSSTKKNRVLGVDEVKWVPTFTISNAVASSCVRTDHGISLIDESTGMLMSATEFDATFQIKFAETISSFPFDEHPLLLYLHQGETQDKDDFVFSPMKDGNESVLLYFPNDNPGNEFYLRGFSCECFVKRAANGVDYAMCHINICASRRPLFYIIKLVVPLFFSTILCFISFLFDVDDLGNRMSIVTTMFLSTTAMMFVLSSLLPRTSILTLIDKYLIFSLVLQLIVAIECCVVASTWGPIPRDTAVQIDLVVKILLLILYVVGTFLFFVPSSLKFLSFNRRDTPDYFLTRTRKGKAPPFYLFEIGKNVEPDEPTSSTPLDPASDGSIVISKDPPM